MREKEKRKLPDLSKSFRKLLFLSKITCPEYDSFVKLLFLSKITGDRWHRLQIPPDSFRFQKF